MPHPVLGDVFVMLCDWQGHCTWTSQPDLPVRIGEPVWAALTAESQEAAKTALSRVVTLRETQEVEVTDRQGKRYRGWLWPLMSPEMAVCILGSRIPPKLARLGPRELECMQLLAQGSDTRTIAETLDISLSTVHTNLRRAKEKLGLRSMEALISFAARYCFPKDVSFGDESATNTG
jgi:DNA-binding CsgD family transcriptional regulator